MMMISLDPPRESTGSTRAGSTFSRSAIVCLALLVGGCATAARPKSNLASEEARDRSVRVYATNLNFSDATLWAVIQGNRRRMGILTGKTEEVFVLPWPTSLDLQIEIDLLAGPRCTTRTMAVDPGDDIELVIDQDLLGGPLCSGGGAVRSLP
jgi:hypothetical protein